MLFTTQESIEDKIIRYLTEKPYTIKALQERLSVEGGQRTIQALYAILRTLTATEAIVKRGSLYVLSGEWRIQVATQLASQDRTELAEGESIRYTLSSLIQHDLQWKSVVLPLHEANPRAPIFFFNQYYVWPYLSESRMQSELDYYASLAKNRTHAFCLIGSDTPADHAFKDRIQNDYVRVVVNKRPFDMKDYQAIFDDYVITTRISSAAMSSIEDAYKQSDDVESLETRLRSLGLEKKKVTLIIERNHEKARRLRKRIAKDFFVPKAMVDEFNLY